MKTENIQAVFIEKRAVGPGQPCMIIGEVGLNHNGDLNMAKRLIDVAAKTGCDCVKFQKRTVSQLAIKSVLDDRDDRFPSFGKTYRQIREHLEFDESQYKNLVNYTREKGLIFLCTAFDIPAVEFLEQFEVPAFKVASHSLTNLALLQKLSKIKKPVIMSTGMCDFTEVDRAVGILRSSNVPLILLHCVSSYPQSPEESNLEIIKVLRERYKVPVGYSGHEIGMLPTLISVGLGAVVVERHITLDAALEGFDHKLSMTPEELKALVIKIRLVEAMLGVRTKAVSAQEQITRDKYHVSMVAARYIKAGEVITEDMITFKNPGTGLPPSKMDNILNRRSKIAIQGDTLISLDQLE